MRLSYSRSVGAGDRKTRSPQLIPPEQFVTTLLDRGVGAHIVKELAGHADLTMTERYAHALRTNKRAAIDVLEGVADRKKK